MAPKIRVIVRIYVGKTLRFQEYVEAKHEREFREHAAKHMAMIGAQDQPFMIEIEFLDEPDIMQKFLRFGSDPAGMVQPIPADSLFSKYPN